MVSDKAAITITAILSIAVLEAVALYRGIDGAALASVIAVLAGLAGYTVGNKTTSGKKTSSQ